jgi:arylsulfatase A-like enzyme
MSERRAPPTDAVPEYTRRRRVCLAALLLAAVAGCSETPDDPRNLLLISIDTLAPRRMSAYGAERQTSPTVADLAKRAIRFTNAYSPSPWTRPAHAAMLTGRYPTRLAPDPNDERLFRLAPSLAERFRRSGFRTGAVTGGGYLARRSGIALGFEQFFFRGGPSDESWDGVGHAIRFLEEHRDTPFFLFFHTYEVHYVYADRRFVQQLEPGRIGPISELTRKGIEVHQQVCCAGMELTPGEREYLLALYDGGIARADEIVRDLLEALDRLGLAENTTIVITSDHGEEFFGNTGRAAYHGHSLYDELLRVPLIWYEPGMDASGPAREQLVSLLDIVPTAIARFRLEPAETLDGFDLSPLLDGGDWQRERALFGEGVLHGPTRFSVLTRSGKLIETPEPRVQRGEGRAFPVPVRAREELYLPGDPHESVNLVDAHPALARELAALLQAHRAAAERDEPQGPAAGLGADTRARLRELGYGS